MFFWTPWGRKRRWTIRSIAGWRNERRKRGKFRETGKLRTGDLPIVRKLTIRGFARNAEKQYLYRAKRGQETVRRRYSCEILFERGPTWFRVRARRFVGRCKVSFQRSPSPTSSLRIALSEWKWRLKDAKIVHVVLFIDCETCRLAETPIDGLRCLSSAEESSEWRESKRRTVLFD